MRIGKAKDWDDAMVLPERYYEDADKAWERGSIFLMHLVIVMGRKQSKSWVSHEHVVFL